MTTTTYTQLMDLAEINIKLAQTERDKALAFSPLSDLIDAMPWRDRVILRGELTAMGEQRQARNLYYDYDKQAWIE